MPLADGVWPPIPKRRAPMITAPLELDAGLSFTTGLSHSFFFIWHWGNIQSHCTPLHEKEKRVLDGSLRRETNTTLLAPLSKQCWIVGTANLICNRAGAVSSVGWDAWNTVSKSTWIKTRFPCRSRSFSFRRSLPMSPVRV